MNSKAMALSLVMILSVNQGVWAQSTSVVGAVDPVLFGAAAEQVDTGNQQSLAEVKALLVSLQDLQNRSKQQSTDQFIHTSELVLSAVGVITMASHLTRDKELESSVAIIGASITGIVQATLDAYKMFSQSGMGADKDLTVANLKLLLAKHQSQLYKIAQDQGITGEDLDAAKQLMSQLAAIQNSLKTNSEEMKGNIDKTQLAIAGVAFLGIALKSFRHLIPLKVRERIMTANEQMVTKAGTKADKAREIGHQTMGFSGFAPILGMLSGFGSESAQAQLTGIIANLQTAEVNLRAVINK
jgi:hypothetical protein